MKYKFTLYFIANSLLLLTCSSNVLAQKIVADGTKRTMTGQDRDKHHCIPSAGYIWSTIKNKCVRVWEVGIRLNSLQEVPEGQPTFSLFILFNNDQSKVELFIPGRKSSTILNRKIQSNAYLWKHKDLTLYPTDEPNGYVLKDGDTEVYATP